MGFAVDSQIGFWKCYCQPIPEELGNAVCQSIPKERGSTVWQPIPERWLGLTNGIPTKIFPPMHSSKFPFQKSSETLFVSPSRNCHVG